MIFEDLWARFCHVVFCFFPLLLLGVGEAGGPGAPRLHLLQQDSVGTGPPLLSSRGQVRPDPGGAAAGPRPQNHGSAHTSPAQQLLQKYLRKSGSQKLCAVQGGRRELKRLGNTQPGPSPS